MATEVETAKGDRDRRPVEAAVLGSSRVPPSVNDGLLHADPAPLHAVPKDTGAEAVLARVESLLGRGHFGAALREAEALKESPSALAARYQLIRQEKVSRAHLGIAERYFLRGDRDGARRFYDRVLHPGGAEPAVREVSDLAGQAFDQLVRHRRALIAGLRDDIREDRYAEWCGRRKTLTDLTILDLRTVRERVFPDFRLEQALGERPPIDPDPGYLDPLPPETEIVAFPSAVPGAVFRAATQAAVDIDAPVATLDPAGRVRASLAMPVIANVLAAKAGLLALDQGLGVSGHADGTVPLFRYEHLRDKAKELIAHIQAIESRMLPIQFALDDFAEVVEAIRHPLAEQRAELEALKLRIVELIQGLADLAQIEQALDEVVDVIAKVEDDCECDWFCWLVTIATGLIFAAGIVAVGLAAAFAIVSTGGLAAGVLAGLLASASAAAAGAVGTHLATITYETFTCENVAVVGRSMKAVLSGVRGAIAEIEAELQHALARRDILIASINALSDQLDQVYESNAARVLDARTLDAIQARYNGLRRSLLTRAHEMARLAENAFNFERDADTRLVKDAYFDPSLKGYGAAESLLHDLLGLDHIELTGRTQKAMQLSQMVSLRKHSPLSFLALAATRAGRFTTTLADFDRWYPGTYLQRIKEVRVEVLVDGQPVPARGYISNDGISLVRFADRDNRRRVDDERVFAEPDEDLARLCYKRLQRRRHVDTMAFPAFESYLHEERMRQLQRRERNFFENVGLESTWLIELLPDQPFDLGRISDIRVWFQYEALFDENLKRALEAKRYTGRREMAALPVLRTLRERGEHPDLSAGLTFKTSRTLFEPPAIEKTVVDAGFALRLKEGRSLGGAAGIEVSFEGAPAAALTTTDEGIVATASEHPAGAGLPELAAMVQGRGVEGIWSVRLTSLPTGVGPDDIDELFLLLNCELAAP